jgi:nucleotide-binding universal stress UspA family protein
MMVEEAQGQDGTGQEMKSLLAVIGDGNIASMLETTLAVAQRFASHIVGLHASLDEQLTVVFGGEVVPFSAQVDQTLEQEEQKRRTAAQRLFDDFMAAHGIMARSDNLDSPTPTAEWRATRGRQNAIVGSFGRIFDLIVIEKPPQRAALAEATLEDAIFESGRPVLMAPPRSWSTIGERVVIAWNGSTETARTIALAMPFLLHAKDVQVISVATGLTPGPSAEDIARGLVWHRIPATARHLNTKVNAGTVWLEECRTVRADLLVKGAYTQSRLRQMIFGGPTRQIIMDAELPVILAH